MCIRLKLGVLHQYGCCPIPVCIYSEIIDSYGNYVSFQAAMKDAAVDG
jgi:hypothetical protein